MVAVLLADALREKKNHAEAARTWWSKLIPFVQQPAELRLDAVDNGQPKLVGIRVDAEGAVDTRFFCMPSAISAKHQQWKDLFRSPPQEYADPGQCPHSTLVGKWRQIQKRSHLAICLRYASICGLIRSDEIWGICFRGRPSQRCHRTGDGTVFQETSTFGSISTWRTGHACLCP